MSDHRVGPASTPPPGTQSGEDFADKAFKTIGALVIVAVMVICAALSRGFCLSVAWTWFIVPLGAPPIGVAHAIGIVAILAFLTHASLSEFKAEREDKSKKDKGKAAVKRILMAGLLPWAWLCFLYIIHLFM